MTIKEIRSLLISLKPGIQDEFRASDDTDDNTPAMPVTIATTNGESWNFQTGDNSFTGGAYSFRHWHTLTLQRRSNCTELARECVNELRGLVEEEKS